MYNRTLHEIMSTRVWMMREDSFRDYSRLLLSNMSARTPLSALELADKEAPFYMEIAPVGGEPKDGGQDAASEGSVLVIPVLGPVTRNGDACSYGSIDHRDMLMEAADDPACKGVVFLLDTPGGSAFALHDYRQGLDRMKQNGKRSVAFVDGMCASAGVAVACQCDYVCAMNGADEIGCIGAMAAFSVQQNGAVDSDGFRFVSVTATQTPDKNAAFNEAAEGDNTLIQEEVDKCASEFLGLIEEMRPQIKKEQRTGKMYPASEVIGSLVDGICTIDDCLEYIASGDTSMLLGAQPAQQAAESEARTEPDEDPRKYDPDLNPDEDPDYDPDEDPDAPELPEPKHPEHNKNEMNYENICAALGIDANDLHVEEDGIFLNEAYVEALNDAIAPKKEETSEEAAPAEEQQNDMVSELASQVESLDKELTEVSETAVNAAAELEQKDAEIADLKKQLEEKVTFIEEQVTLASELADANTKALEQKDAEIAEAKAAADELSEKMAALDAQLTAKEKELEELSEAGAPAPQVANAGTEKAVEAEPKKTYREMSVHEKAKASVLFNRKK